MRIKRWLVFSYNQSFYYLVHVSSIIVVILLLMLLLSSLNMLSLYICFNFSIYWHLSSWLINSESLHLRIYHDIRLWLWHLIWWLKEECYKRFHHKFCLPNTLNKTWRWWSLKNMTSFHCFGEKLRWLIRMGVLKAKLYKIHPQRLQGKSVSSFGLSPLPGWNRGKGVVFFFRICEAFQILCHPGGDFSGRR